MPAKDTPSTNAEREQGSERARESSPSERATDSNALDTSGVAQLHRSIGNRAVAQRLRPQDRGNAQGEVVQRAPGGTYAATTPAANGMYWDTRTTYNHRGSVVPNRSTAVMRDPAYGSRPGANPPGWAWLKAKFGRLKGQWVRFHIINDNLGGQGTADNLVPTRHTLNHNASWRALEESAKTSASTNHSWTYVDVAIDYHNDFPAGIPRRIDAEWGRYVGGKWTPQPPAVHMEQANPDDGGGINFLPAAQITLAMLQGWGLNNAQAQTAHGLIGQTWNSQEAFDDGWEAAAPNIGDAAINAWYDVQGRMYVDEDDAFAGPYGVVVRTT